MNLFHATQVAEAKSESSFGMYMARERYGSDKGEQAIFDVP
jgi:hypothetical protein